MSVNSNSICTLIQHSHTIRGAKYAKIICLGKKIIKRGRKKGEMYIISPVGNHIHDCLKTYQIAKNRGLNSEKMLKMFNAARTPSLQYSIWK